MTGPGSVVRPAHAHPRPGPARWRSAAVVEWRVQVRTGIVAGTLAITACWTASLRFVPVGARPAAVAWVLLLDVAALGFFVAPALAVVDRANGVTRTCSLTRWHPGAALVVRLALVVTWAMLSAAVLAAGAAVTRPVVVVAGAGATTLLLALVSVATLGRADSLVAWIPRVPVATTGLLVPALAVATGLSRHPALSLSPVTGGWRWLSGDPSLGSLAGLLVTSALLGWWVARPGWVTTNPARHRARRPTTWTPAPGSRWVRWPRLRAMRSQARADRHVLGGDALVWLLVAGVPIVAITVRVATTPLLAWTSTRWGLDLAPHLPALWAFLLVVHTATMFGSVAGLSLLEDRDAGVLPAIALTRSGLGALLAWRLGLAAMATAVMVVAGLCVAGAAAGAGVPGLLATAAAAAATSTVPAMLLATLARDRAAGMVVMKAIALPLYVPLAWWFVRAPAAVAFGLVPTAWPARTLWATSVRSAVVAAVLAVATSAVVVAAGVARLRRSLAT